MPRHLRLKSESGIYHVIFRGINKQNIFENDNDYHKYLEILNKYKDDCEYEIFAYCLMSNHVHVLIKVGKTDLATVMKKIGTSYVSWYNWQYNRSGHLFQDRFKSEPVENDSYFLTVLRYIHQNPVIGGLSNTVDSYKWSSYNKYFENGNIINRNYVLDFFNLNNEKALQQFAEYNNEIVFNKCIDSFDKTKMTISDAEIKRIVSENFGIELYTIQSINSYEQKKILLFLKEIEGISLRQISRLTGFTTNKITKS